MEFPFVKLYKSLTRNGGRSVSRGDLIWYGALLLGVLLVVLLATDGYLFYISQLRERPAPAALRRNVTLSEQEIDETLRLIDDRDNRLKILLGEGE